MTYFITNEKGKKKYLLRLEPRICPSIQWQQRLRVVVGDVAPVIQQRLWWCAIGGGRTSSSSFLYLVVMVEVIVPKNVVSKIIKNI